MQKVTLLDGGMGQELIRRSGKEPSPLWSAQVMLESPELVEQLHLDFIMAGARVITINAYSATPERLQEHGQAAQFSALQTAACHAALQARERSGIEGVQVAGCLPPLVASYHPELAPDNAQSLSNYRRVVNAQAESVDLFICETMASINEAVLASTAALESGKPVWVGLTLDDDNPENLRSGEHWKKAVEALHKTGVSALMLNCSRPETINVIWKEFTALSEVPVGAYANGFTSVTALARGGTVDVLESREDLGPEAYSRFAMDWVRNGACFIGGCCEVGPEHIARLNQSLQEEGYC